MSGLMNNNLIIVSLLSIFCYSCYVKIFRKLGQIEREEGLRSHKKKTGTITMGGIIFIILPIFFIKYKPEIYLIYLSFLSFGLIGFIDDLLIIKYHKNDGLKAKVKLIIEILISGIIFYYYLDICNNTILDLYFIKIDLKWLYGLFILWFLTASSNAWNLLDGVDGLCSGCSLLIDFGLFIVAYKKNELDICNLLFIVGIVLFVFWCFNLPKAFLFMGDVGSLSLGVLFSMTSIYLDFIVGFIVMALLFIFDTLSVIIQVSYYKKTKKRIFKMAPFHHHLELCGLKEIHIDIIFYIIQGFLVYISLFLA